jgi:hypothetical protein
MFLENKKSVSEPFVAKDFFWNFNWTSFKIGPVYFRSIAFALAAGLTTVPVVMIFEKASVVASRAYLLYQNSMRDQFKADNPGMTFGQLSKYTSHMYKSLTAREKAEWDERAKRDKERYLHEMKHYVPPHGFDSHGNLVVQYSVSRKASKKAPKDPNMPKRARGSFVLFTKDERPKIQQENPQIKFTDLGAVLGKRWRALPEEERRKYDALAEQDKQRFAQEMEIYRSQNQLEHGGNMNHNSGGGYYMSQQDQGHHPPELYYNHQDDPNQQYYLQDQQPMYQQQHGGVGVVHQSQMYQNAPPPLNGHDDENNEQGYDQAYYAH